MNIEITLKYDIWSTPSKKSKEKPKIVKRGVKCKMLVDTEDIRNPRELINQKGMIRKNVCEITLKDVGQIVVEHSYDHIKSLIAGPQSTPVIGFKIDDKSNNKSNNKTKTKTK